MRVTPARLHSAAAVSAAGPAASTTRGCGLSGLCYQCVCREDGCLDEQTWQPTLHRLVGRTLLHWRTSCCCL